MAPLLLHLRDELLEAHLLDRKFEEVFEEYVQTTYLILNQCYVAMQEGQKILQEFGVLLYCMIISRREEGGVETGSMYVQYVQGI